MDRLRRVLRRRSAKVLSMGEESSREPGQEDRGPICRDEEGPIRARRWLCPICCQRKPAAPSGRGKEGKKTGTSKSRWRWPWVRLGRREPAPSQCQAPEEPCSSPPGSSGSLEPVPAAPQQEAAPCRAGDEGPAALGQELSQAHSSPCLSRSSSWDDWHTSQESGSTSPSTSSSSSLEDPENSPEAKSTSTSSGSSSEDTDSSEESSTTTSTSSSSSEDSSSSLESGTSPAPGATRTVIPSPAGEELEEEEDEEEEEEEDEEDGRSPEEAALLLVKKHLQDPGEMLDGKDRQRFLLAIISLTIAADQSREVAVELEGLKAAVLERIVDLMENISVEADRKHILAYSIDAIRCLSDPKLSLEPALESRLLQAAVDKSFLAIGRETHRNQVMQRLYEEYLEGLLCCVLSSAPSLGKLYSIWEHFTSWIEPSDAQHRALGMKMFTGVLAFAVQLLPQFEGSPDIPEVGDMAACLGLMINDPEEITSCKARAGMYLLTQILLHQRGQDMRGAEELRCKHQMEQSQVQKYRDLARVGEGLRKILLEEQRKSFLQRALHAVHSRQMHISQAGLVFLYAILGEASCLMGHKEKEIPIRVVNKLFIITGLKELPKDLQGHSLLVTSSSALASLQPPTLAPAATPADHLDPGSTSLREDDLPNLTGSPAATKKSCNSAKATTQATD
ncbi:uncharacterized protein LOC132244033 [Alligator mississippiensis]|uniref:uncharacterized protein LOC132244033 n=1 Tax=Alligator mississippiensis TaxID=8496 RepID=UPI002877691D|nr:uncharacterized protein LOC132244033 [Alligator mississippiensis]